MKSENKRKRFKNSVWKYMIGNFRKVKERNRYLPHQRKIWPLFIIRYIHHLTLENNGSFVMNVVVVISIVIISDVGRRVVASSV